MLSWCHTNKEVAIMYQIHYVRGHIEVYGADGSFLFSADNMREVEELTED